MRLLVLLRSEKLRRGVTTVLRTRGDDLTFCVFQATVRDESASGVPGCASLSFFLVAPIELALRRYAAKSLKSTVRTTFFSATK
jgi:hypothetical protein